MLLKFLVLLAVAAGCTLAASHKIAKKEPSNLQSLEQLTARFQRVIEYEQVPRVVRSHGYTCRAVQVTSDDGYIITIHHVESGRFSRTTGPPVILHHGLLSSSASWTLQDAEQGLAYLLTDAGYDVWMPNARGNTYSNTHADYPNVGKQYWGFSWHEMGYYDLPAVIDYVLEETGEEQVYYIGHSMGTTIFFAAMASHPEYNDKIRLMSALAPVAYVKNLPSPIRNFAPYWKEIQTILEDMTWFTFLPYRPLISVLLNIMCGLSKESETVCQDILSLIVGFDKPQYNETLQPYVFGQHPAGTSIYTITHYAQEILSGDFCQFDYGEDENMEKYGQSTPPSYDISQITAPIAMYYSFNDWLADPQDVMRFANQLPKVLRMYRVNDDLFNHLDYLFAKDVVPLCYREVMDFMTGY